MDALNINELKNAKDAATGFLRKYKMYFEDIDIHKYIDLFLDEMQKGLEGEESSLKMFPTFINFCDKIPSNKPVIVLDAGGTNLRSAVITFDGKNEPVIQNLKQSYMPGLKSEVSKDEFFKVIVENIKDIINLSDDIGFVFSYPIEIYPNRDGKVGCFTKEIKAKEVEGELIGENLKAAIKKQGFKGDKKIVMLNDTVASLLSGISAFQNRNFESFIGFILGTGSNASYIEKNSNIKKKLVGNFCGDDYQIINIESGNFSKGPMGEIDLSFDSKTINPDLNCYEKMFSGAYLGGLATEVVRFALKDGLFSDAFFKKFNSSKVLESRDIDDFLFYPPRSPGLIDLIKGTETRDLVILYHIFDDLVERASIFTSIILASVIIKSGKGVNPCNPVCITAEGSSFYKLKNFQARVEYHMRNVLSQRGSYYYEINKVDNAILLGAAAAGLGSRQT
jgi:hexokinase